MAAVDDKYHVKIGDLGLLLARSVRLNRHSYVRNEAPAFVNKFASGDPNYRDATFFGHWAQLDWVNGFEQEYLDDPGRFYRSSSVDTTAATKLALEEAFNSAGQIKAGVTANVLATLPRAQTWANDNYGYRQRLSITAPTGQDMPPSYPVKITIDTAALQTATKLLANRNDWRVYYYNGTSWVDLIRDYVGTTETWVALQAAISGDAISNDYYVYYDYSGETSSRQPGYLLSDAALEAYWKFESDATDETANNNDLSGTGTPTHPAGKFGNAVELEADTPQYYSITDGGQTGLDISGDISISAWIDLESLGSLRPIATKYDSGNGQRSYRFAVDASGQLELGVSDDGSADDTHFLQWKTDADVITAGTLYHVVVTFDISTETCIFYVDNVVKANSITIGSTLGAALHDSTCDFLVGGDLNSGSIGNKYDGSIDDLFIFSRVLTAAEVQYLAWDEGGYGWNGVYGFPINYGNTKLLAHVVETSGTNVQDTSGNSHDITLVDGAAIIAAGKFGNAMEFESGNSEYGSITDHADLKPTAKFTIEAWIKTSDSSGVSMYVFQSFSKDPNMAGLILLITGDGYARLTTGKNTGVVNETDYDYVIGTTDIRDGEWHHIAGTYDGTNLKIYVDNILEATEPWGFYPVYAATNYVCIGADNVDGTPAATYPFNGSIAGLSLNNGSARTSFPAGVVEDDPTVTAGSEVAKAAAAVVGSAAIFAGCDDGKIYEWDGGTSWSEVYDTSNVTVNCAVLAEFSGTKYLYFGSGDPDAIVDGTAKVYRTSDGAAFTLAGTLTEGTTSAVLSMAFYKDSLYVGAGPSARIYSTDDGTTFTLSQDIDDPNSPGYPYTMIIYNDWLFVGGGHPEKFRSSRSNGFFWRYDTFEWKSIYPFDHTVVRSMAVYDSLLFIGTVNKDLYVFNTASVDKLFTFPWDVSMEDMTVYKDKLAIALGPSDGVTVTGEEAIYLFDRNGLHNAFNGTATGYTCLKNINNLLLCGTSADGNSYRTLADEYVLTGNLQSSYYEAQLPSVDKLFRDITLMFDSLETGTSIAVAYKTDESDANWTSLGTADTVDSTEETFTFAVGTYAKKISIRATLTTTDSSKTPVLRKALIKYVLAPDFKYIWKMTIAAVDNIVWQDETQPISLLGAAVTAGDTTLTLDDVDGFPDPNGSTFYATLTNYLDVEDRFTYTGIAGSTLTGIPASGDYALLAHAAAEVGVSEVAMRGRDIHQSLLDIKQTKKMYTFTDIDENTYTVFFNSFQTDGWVIDPITDSGFLENEVPITLLEA